jgi:hypothetical protein
LLKLLFLGAGLALAPSIALADGNGGEPAKARSGLICRDVGETGSRLGGKRICMSRDEWEAQRREARANVERAQTMQTNPCGAATKC